MRELHRLMDLKARFKALHILEQSVPDQTRQSEIREMGKTMAEVWLEEGMEIGS